jgi:hypothetical protein
MTMRVNDRNIILLLFITLAAGFIYRLTLTTMNTYPPGADIGLHESVINSILAPKTSLIYNYFHMGGGVSATNPGYHLFAAFIIKFTGAPDYFVQAAVASLFSTMIVASAFLVVKQVWGEKAGLAVAVLATFSASDILMLTWAGYPNILALSLIPLLFYLLLQPAKLKSKSFIVATSIVVGALFLTHVFSALVFLAITILALLISIFSSKSIGFNQTKLWLTPIFFGVILVSPYLLSVIPVYFGSESAITGSVSIMKQAVVETRIVSTVILGLAIIPIIFFLAYSKKRQGRFITPASVLFASAVFVPLVAAQCYIFGFFLDYERFLYFLALPVITCIGLIIVESSEIVTKALRKIKPQILNHTKTATLSLLIVACLCTSLLGASLFTLPDKAAAQVDFFQVMNAEEYEAIQWIQKNTPQEAIFVADANFGWWLSGFAQRRTLSAVDPQYLILQREFEPAQVAANLLKTNYLVDNGILQIEQSGPYVSGSTHDIYASVESSIYKPLVFSLNDTHVSMLYREGGVAKEVKLGAFADSDIQVVNDGNSTSFIISRQNGTLRVTEEITVFRGVRFAEITFVFQNEGSVVYDWLRVPFRARGELVQYANSIGIIDNTMQWVNQIVLPQNQLGKDVSFEENGDYYELVFNLGGKSNAVLSFYVGLCTYSTPSEPLSTEYKYSLIENNTKTYRDIVSDEGINSFDYRTAIRKWNISYIAARDPQAIARFMDDRIFDVAFRNSQVTVFKVTGT